MTTIEKKSTATRELVFKWIMFTSAISGMGMAASLFPLSANVLFVMIPSTYVLLFAKPVIFERLKLTTLLIPKFILIFAALRFFNPQLLVDFLLLMLMINILEATFTDLLKHKKYYNAISGFVLAIGVIGLKGMWSYNAPVGNFYLVEGFNLTATICYIIAYTIWNWIFVTDEFSPAVALMHVGFLLAPIIGCISTLWMGAAGGFGMWMLIRSNTLAIGGWLQIGAKNWFEKEYHNDRFAKFIEKVQSTPVQIILMTINIVLIGVVLYYAIAGKYIGYTFLPLAAPQM